MSDTPVLTDLSEALIHASEVERVLMMIGNGEATPGQLPLDSLAKLISFTRYGRTQGATLTAGEGLGPWTKHDCPALAKAKDNEPIFTLRAQDLSADDTVQRWIDKNVDRLGPSHPKIRGAIATRDAMEAWPNRKAAD